jgi:hypothetical protein
MAGASGLTNRKYMGAQGLDSETLETSDLNRPAAHPDHLKDNQSKTKTPGRIKRSGVFCL